MTQRAIALAILCGILAFAGCGGPSAKVTGKVTGNGKAIVGNILFSPVGEGPDNTGEAVSAGIKPDGSYELRLRTIGKHRVVVTPADIKYPVPEGELDHPCDYKTPQQHDVKQGDNVINVDLPVRKK